MTAAAMIWPARAHVEADMLSRLRIRQKLAVLLAIPLTAVALVMSAFTVSSVDNARAYSATAQTALAARDVGALIQNLQRERLLAIGYLVVPTMELSALVGQGQTAGADVARLAAESRTADIIARSRPQLDALVDLRRRVAARTVEPKQAYDAYRSAIFTLTEGLNLATARVADAAGMRRMLALDSLMRSNEEASSAGAIVVGATVDPSFDAVLLNSVVGADQQHLVRFHALVPPDQYALVDTVQAGNAAARLREHIVTVSRGGHPTTADVSDALSAALTYTGLRRLAQDRFARDTALLAQRDANQAGVAAAAVGVGAAVLFLGVVALAITVGRSISRPLRRLGRAVATVAELSRAELVRVADSEALDGSPPELASVEVDSRDEIGDLAMAVNRVQSTAAEMLERQASARANVATMFANVSRRTQNLVGRQLQLIEEVARSASDPATSERLSQLEHVTTRLRRSADSLLVISGTIDQQITTVGSPLADVIDAALIEIEGFNSVEVVQPLPDVALAADVARDVRLLLAELLENATNFTPPGSSVRIGATLDRRSGGQPADCAIAIVDNGLGMSPARMEDENRRLVERERLDVAPTRMLGLFVVGRIARRHGLAVRLDPSPGRGVTATVRVPAHLLTVGTTEPAGAALPAGAAAGNGGTASNPAVVLPPKALAAIESAARSGPFPWLGEVRQVAIGSAPVRAVAAAAHPVNGAPVSGAPVSAVPVSSAPVSGPGGRGLRDPDAERDALNDYVSGLSRAAQPELDDRSTPAERHQ